MYTFKVGKDNCIVATNVERIVQRSKLENTLCIRVNNEHNGLNMQECLAVMYYALPDGNGCGSKELTPEEELYNESYVEYLIPVDTWLTAYGGDVQFEIKFYRVSMDEESNIEQYVRKVTNGIIHIASSRDWASGIADSFLDTVDQRIIQLMIAQNRQEELNEEMYMNMNNKADGIAKDNDTNEIYLTANGKKLGKGVIDSDSYSKLEEEGVPSVDFTENPNHSADKPNDDFNVVEF